MHELTASLAQIRNAWLAGRVAIDAAPLEWREAIGNDELALLGLAGHAIDVLSQQSPNAALETRPLLPILEAPLLPSATRARFRRLLASPKAAPSIELPLIAFVAARGFAAHPADWMPDVKDDWIPEIYAPWLDWVRAETALAVVADALNQESYDRWPWSERRKALAAMRQQDPAQALAIIAAKASGEPAERRLRLIETLQIGLSDRDADYLGTLAKDRSDRVQALSRALLARLGLGGDTSELAAELAATLELKTVGLIKRHKQLVIKALKTGAQMMRRRELFGLVPLPSLAAALNASELDLAESAPDGAFHDVLDFVGCVAATGSDAAVRALVGPLLDANDAHAAAVRPLMERLSAEERRVWLPRIVARDIDMFETTLAIAGQALGQETLSTVSASPNYATLKSSVEAYAHGDDAGRAAATRTLDILLPRLGLLLDTPSARALLDEVTSWGLSPAEPRLDMLHLNIALTSENAP